MDADHPSTGVNLPRRNTGNPRAGKFAEGDTELAIKAASLLGYRVARLSDPAIAGRLREGNVFARGASLIGRVSRSLYDQVVGAADNDRDEDVGAAAEKAGP